MSKSLYNLPLIWSLGTQNCAPNPTHTIRSNIENTLLQTFLNEETFRLHYSHYISLSVEFNAPAKIRDLRIISHLVQIVSNSESLWKRFILAQSVLSELDLDWLGILDNEINIVLDMVASSKDLSDFRKKATHVIFTQFRKQITHHGTTIEMNINGLSVERDFATLVEVLEVRQRELNHTRVVSHENEVDLTPLRLTAYGYDILAALEFGPKTDADGLQLIESELQKSGFSFYHDEVDDSQPSTVFSENLRNHILWIVQSRNSTLS
jgi:hypothetical protein